MAKGGRIAAGIIAIVAGALETIGGLSIGIGVLLFSLNPFLPGPPINILFPILEIIAGVLGSVAVTGGILLLVDFIAGGILNLVAGVGTLIEIIYVILLDLVLDPPSMFMGILNTILDYPYFPLFILIGMLLTAGILGIAVGKEEWKR